MSLENSAPVERYYEQALLRRGRFIYPVIGYTITDRCGHKHPTKENAFICGDFKTLANDGEQTWAIARFEGKDGKLAVPFFSWGGSLYADFENCEHCDYSNWNDTLANAFREEMLTALTPTIERLLAPYPATFDADATCLESYNYCFVFNLTDYTDNADADRIINAIKDACNADAEMKRWTDGVRNCRFDEREDGMSACLAFSNAYHDD